jgi:hypothetical protein
VALGLDTASLTAKNVRNASSLKELVKRQKKSAARK